VDKGVRAEANAHMAVTIAVRRSRIRHVPCQRNLAIAKRMECVTGLRRCASHLVARVTSVFCRSSPPPLGGLLSMVYDINTQLGIAFVDSLRAPDLVALGEALTTVLEDRRLATGSRICVDCGQLAAHDDSTDLSQVFRELYVSSVRRRPRRVALIVRDEASQMAARTFVQQLPGSLSACTYVAADVSGAMKWLGRGC